MQSKNKPKGIKVAIIGGGFGGIEVFKDLQSDLPKNSQVTIFNDRTDFIFTPLLHEAATGGVNLTNIAAPIRSFIKSKNAEFVHAYVNEIDTQSKIIKTATCSFEYDYLVIATGSVSNTRDLKGANDNSHFLKTVEDSVRLRKSILETLEKYSQLEEPNLVKFTVIGGGSTGVELALEIDEYIRYTLSKYYKCSQLLEDFEVFIVCPSEQVLIGLDGSIRKEAMCRLNKSKVKLKMSRLVTEVGPNYVITDKNEKIVSSVIVWCGGVEVSIPQILNITKVQAQNTLNSPTHPEIFFLGDCVNYGTSVPMDAQAAVKQAKIVSKNITALISGSKLTAFSYKSSGTLVSLGRWHAAGKIGPFFIKGPVAWWIWRTIYLFKFPLRPKRIKIAIDWTVAIFSGRDISNV